MEHERRLSPEDFLHFVELDEFSQDWKDLGFDIESDLWELQMVIMSAPEAAPVIRGTGGLRKLRFARPGAPRGKSGGIRVCYVYCKTHWTVLLVMAYGKGRKETLTAAEKDGIRDYLGQIESWLASHNY